MGWVDWELGAGKKVHSAGPPPVNAISSFDDH